MRHLRALFLMMAIFLALPGQAQEMDNKGLQEILDTISDTVQGSNGNWQFVVNGLPMFCVTDQTHNRMRIVTPIQHLEDVSAEQLAACMEANFHTALDARYAVSDDILWVAYIHPLRELQPGQVADAIIQVYNAALTFGTSYSSTDLSFPQPKPKTKRS